MLRVARGRAGSELVRWQQGDAEVLPTGWADLLIMCGHVAQVFLTDDQWSAALREIRRCIDPHGTLAFETRNPVDRGWERWTREQTLRIVETDEGPVEFWHDTMRVHPPTVTYATTARNTRSGHATTDLDTLAFRDEATIRSSLAAEGFDVDEIVGDWDGSPCTAASPELIVTARTIE